MKLSSLFKNKKKHKKKNKTTHYLQQEILRRDKIIKDLKERNEIILKTTVRQSKQITELKEKIKKLHS